MRSRTCLRCANGNADIYHNQCSLTMYFCAVTCMFSLNPSTFYVSFWISIDSFCSSIPWPLPLIIRTPTPWTETREDATITFNEPKKMPWSCGPNLEQMNTLWIIWYQTLRAYLTTSCMYPSNVQVVLLRFILFDYINTLYWRCVFHSPYSWGALHMQRG